MRKQLLIGALLACMSACKTTPVDNDATSPSVEAAPPMTSEDVSVESAEPRVPGLNYGGAAPSYKVPLPQGFSWEVTQSWAEHCETCNDKGYNEIFDGFFGDFCELSHADSCYSVCKYAWDFNLPGNFDNGKPVLAVADGIVKEVSTGFNGGWGNSVVIDHGGNVCSRYVHLLDDSITVSEDNGACQGLKVGEIGKSGNAAGEHLHFQFEECDSGLPLAMGFTDGNGVPVCTMGSDVFDEQNNYSFLILSNEMVETCGEPASVGELPEGGWVSGGCKSLPGCPLVKSCNRNFGHLFEDNSVMSQEMTETAAYLWGECALDGKSDGGFHPFDTLTRAEALKVPLFLFGIMESCGAGADMNFNDVDANDWFFSVIACGVQKGVVDNAAYAFNPNSTVNFVEAAKFAVLPAVLAGVIELKIPAVGHFKKIPPTHWGYPYMETLYAYGGIPGVGGAASGSAVADLSPEQPVKRWEYALMVASLSPCNCQNVKCGANCVCAQSASACVDPEAFASDVGGLTAVDSVSGSDYNSVLDLGIECYVSTNWTECDYPDWIFTIKCEMTNDGNETVNVNTLEASLEDGGGSCELTGDSLSSGIGYEKVEPGETENLNGNFEVTCDDVPSGEAVSLSLDLWEKYPGESVEKTYGVFDLEIPIWSGLFVGCEPPCQPSCGGAQCGDNGCGGSCGTCLSGSICLGGQCCQPKSCFALGVGCGLAFDGCAGTLNCGSCASGKKCENGTCVNICTPQTCSQMGVQCGTAFDGCSSTLSCGGCSAGMNCVGGSCVPSCIPKSCAQVGVQCGATFDGCGGNLNCGGCAAGQTCVGGTCIDVCQPKSCGQLGVQCGMAFDGCGSMLSCGSCDPDEACNLGMCVEVCQPQTCAQLGLECGLIFDGCGSTLNCGSCAEGQACGDGVCKNLCKPQTCADLGVQCGLIFDGCGSTLNCGSCASGQTCENGACVDLCKPQTCEQLGAACGTVFDGCSEMLDCGECPSEVVCTASGSPLNCMPQTCSQLDVTCGFAYDDCGAVLYCGACPPGKICAEGACVSSCTF